MNKKVLSLLGMAFIGCAVYAQEKTQDSVTVEQLETVVLDTKFKLDREKSGKVIYKITQKDLEKVQGQSLVQTINTVSGIEIGNSKSNRSANLSYKVRGGSTGQVVILIDGVQVSDPSNINAEFDLRLLDVNTIESIEIVKGGVSTLYGTGAAAGVINITTKKATDKKVSGAFFMDLGSNRAVVTDKYELNAVTTGVNVNGKLNKFDYLAAYSVEQARGVSAAKSIDETIELNDDPFKRENANVRLGYDFSDSFKFGAFANYNKATMQYDAGALADGDNETISENLQLGLTSEYKYDKGSLVLNASVATTDRNSEKTSFPATYESKTIVADLYNKYKFNKNIWVVAGVNFQEQESQQAGIPFGASELENQITKDTTNVTLVDPYVNATYFTDFGLTVNAGVRMNNHSNYGSHFVYSVNPSYAFKLNDKLNAKVFATGSTAFIAPTLYQQYGPTYGNKDLDPQESLNGEAGFELNYNKKYRLSAVAFHREDENGIAWSPAGYENVEDNKVITQGVELEGKMNLVKNLDLTANYTFVQLDDELSYLSTVRLPKHKANANLSYVLKEKTSLSLAYQFNDKRNGVYFTPSWTTEEKVLDAYSLVNFFVSHQLTNNLELNGSLFNIFDEEFEEVFGYSTLGRNYKVGLRLKF